MEGSPPEKKIRSALMSRPAGDSSMLTATIRSDGSSRLAEGYKWHTYPAVSAGWNLGNEPVMQTDASISKWGFTFDFWGRATELLLINSRYQASISIGGFKYSENYV